MPIKMQHPGGILTVTHIADYGIFHSATVCQRTLLQAQPEPIRCLKYKNASRGLGVSCQKQGNLVREKRP